MPSDEMLCKPSFGDRAMTGMSFDLASLQDDDLRRLVRDLEIVSDLVLEISRIQDIEEIDVVELEF